MLLESVTVAVRLAACRFESGSEVTVGACVTTAVAATQETRAAMMSNTFMVSSNSPCEGMFEQLQLLTFYEYLAESGRCSAGQKSG